MDMNLPWRAIDDLPNDDRLVLAKTSDGRAMVYRSSILFRNLKGPTPDHLSFPATHWMPIPGDEGDARILTCVYCGHEYPQGTPASGDKVLTDHIRECSKHPLRAAEATIATLRKALVGLVGESDPSELKAMEAAMRMLPAPEADKAVTINAIHALLATAPSAGGEGA